MRLSPLEQKIICDTFKEYFAPTDHLWLFGSRADDTKRGGDIDLYVETKESDLHKIRDAERKFVVALWQRMGEQRIDVVINQLHNEKELPIYRVARKTGVQMV